MPRLNYMLTGGVSRKTFSPAVHYPGFCYLVNGRFTLVKYEVFHPSISQLLTRLAE